MSRASRRLLLAACALAIPGIGWVDYVSGPFLGMSLFYIVPIAISAWFGGVGIAVPLATLAAGTWFWADMSVGAAGPLAVSIWNAFTRLVIFISEGVLIAVLRRDQARLREHVVREAALARTDAMTGLPNVRALTEALDEHLSAGGKDASPFALLYFDLDNFKQFNDGLGHAAGDAILEHVGTLLRSVIPDGSVPARLGGDEFAALITTADVATVEKIAWTLVERIERIGAAYSEFGFGATVGVAWFRTAPATVDDVMRASDEAMYRGKAQGKGRVVVTEIG